MNTLPLALFFVLIVLVVLIFKRNNSRYKPSALKKSELIKKYEYDMLQIIAKYENDKDELQKQKVEFLKKASHELHNNIFFDEAEAKQIIQKLASF